MNLESFSINGVTYRQQYRSCGRSCAKCPNHGPYWYAIYWRNGQPKTQYMKAAAMDPILALRPTGPRPSPATPMLVRTAARILGVSLSHPFDRVQPIYLAAVKAVKGRGDEARQKRDRIEEAWRVLCEYHEWM